MLSRRNIRIKVMQVLYALNRDPNLDLESAIELYNQCIWRSYRLYLFHLYLFSQTALCAKDDAKRRASKHLPSEEDKAFKPWLADNPLMRCILENDAMQSLFNKEKIKEQIDPDIARHLYTDFLKEDDYKEYHQARDLRDEDHKKMLLSLYKFCYNHDLFVESTLDHYPNWVDDKSLVVGTMKKSIKALPTDKPFFEEHYPDREATKGFGEELLRNVYVDDEALLKLIKPTLKNWDADRVAIIDMILLKMALAELINFSTIPTKVTLNEFLEISKLYSTAKSKDFINGILDRLMKELQKQGMINKKGRGLME